MKNFYFVLCLLFFSAIRSQSVDVRINEINYGGDSNPRDLIKINNKIFFKAQDYKGISNMYVYDVSNKKTELVFNNYTSTTEVFQVTVGNTLYFLNYTGTNWQLVKSNGSFAGTEILVNFNVSLNWLREFKQYEGKFYLIFGNDLWVSDGTSSGTLLLKTFNNSLTGGIGLDGLTPFKGKMYFGASDEPVNKEVWYTDGTVSGTQKLKEIHPTYSSLDSKFLALVGGDYLYFGAMYGQDLYGLFKTDGTSEGTTMIRNFSYFYSLRGVSFGDKILFGASEPDTGGELWISDGTPAGTHIVKDTNQGSGNGFTGGSNFIFNLDGDVYYTVQRFEPGAQKMEIWKTDGTASGTMLVNTINIYIEKAFVSSDRRNIIFNTSDSSSTYRYFVFRKDGSIVPLPISVFPGNHSFVDLSQNEVVLTIYDNENYGTELFSYDLNNKSYQNLVDINSAGSANPSTFYVNSQGDLIFQSESKKYGNEFFRMNHKTFTPQLVKDIFPKYGETLQQGELITIGDFLYLKNIFSYNGSNYIIRTNGTEEKTEMLGTSAGLNINSDDLFDKLNDQTLIFTSNSYLPNSKLYKLENTKEIPEVITELKLAKPDGANSYYQKTFLYNGMLYFLVNENNKNVVYKTDGTSANTKKVLNFSNMDGSDGNPTLLGVYNGKLLLSKNKQKYGANSELWSYDSQTENLTKVKTYYYKNNSDQQNQEESIMDISINNNMMYIMARVGNTNDFYVTENGVENYFFTSQTSFSKMDALECGDNIFILAGSDKFTTYQIWKTDKTSNGTYPVEQNYNGIGSISCLKGYIYYVKGDRKSISRSNGKPEENINLGINFINTLHQKNFTIQKLISDNENLHLVASSDNYGSELYSVLTELPVYLNVKDFNNIDQKLKLLLYPNPASDFIKIKYKTDLDAQSYIIYNLSGNVIKQGLYLDPEKPIDVSALTKGLYVIEIKTKAGTSYSQKFIKN